MNSHKNLLAGGWASTFIRKADVAVGADDLGEAGENQEIQVIQSARMSITVFLWLIHL
jgi:hypothetical protein